MTSKSIELNKVFNFNITKLNKKFKTIYLIINKNITIDNLIIELSKLKTFTLSPDFKSILNNILIKEIKETLITLTIKKTDYNLHISLIDNETVVALNLLHSLLKNNIRNINLLVININIYLLLERFLISLYNTKSKKELNFYFNLLNNNLDNKIIKNIILDIKSLYMCKYNIDVDLKKVSGITEYTATSRSNKFKYYENAPRKINNTYVLYTSNTSKSISSKIINTLKIVLINNISKKSNNKFILLTEPFDSFSLKYFGQKCIYIDYNSLDYNNILYSKNTPITLIDNLYNCIHENSLPILLTKTDDIKVIKSLKLNIKDNCLLIKLLSNI